MWVFLACIDSVKQGSQFLANYFWTIYPSGKFLKQKMSIFEFYTTFVFCKICIKLIFTTIFSIDNEQLRVIYSNFKWNFSKIILLIIKFFSMVTAENLDLNLPKYVFPFFFPWTPICQFFFPWTYIFPNTNLPVFSPRCPFSQILIFWNLVFLISKFSNVISSKPISWMAKNPKTNFLMLKSQEVQKWPKLFEIVEKIQV